MTRKKVAEMSEEEQQVALAQLKDLQQRFVELLLTGKSITEAARALRIGRRTATYWMAQDTFVRYAYERERQRAATEFRERIAKLNDLTLTALEDALSPDANPDVRLSVAKFLYSSNLEQFGTLAPLADAERLVDKVIADATDDRLFGKRNDVQIYNVPDD